MQHWNSIATLHNERGSVVFTDLYAPEHSQRFYRVVLQARSGTGDPEATGAK
jgi:hypothetical protein